MPHQPYFRIIDGADTAILFVHGIVGTPDQFSALLPLVPQEWSCVNLLLPGHGGSVSDFSHASMAQWRQYVAHQIDVLASTHSRVLLAGIPIAVGAAVYFVCVILMKTITREDCLLLPKGEKIAKLLRLS